MVLFCHAGWPHIFFAPSPVHCGSGGTENEEYMKKIRPYLWRGGALVLAAALVVLLVLSGMGLSTQEPEPLPQPPAQTIRTEGQGGASQQEKPNAPEQPEDPEDEDTPELERAHALCASLGSEHFFTQLAPLTPRYDARDIFLATLTLYLREQTA